MLQLGNLKIEGVAALAPMAGVADRAMREICMAYGAAFCVGELTSAKGVSMGDKKSRQLLSCGEAQRPMASQIFGGDPATMAEAARIAAEFSPDFLDINMGCPAPKVISSGGGAVLMKDLKKAGEIIRAVVHAVDLPVTVKMRVGWDEENLNCTELAKIAEQNGAAAVTVHGRTRQQMYAPGIHYNEIAAVKQAVSIPVIANGDIFTAKDAVKMYERTGCDLVMVGRGAMGSPWLFQQINALFKRETVLPDPPLAKKMADMLRQVELMLAYKDPHNAILESRKHTAWYMKGLQKAAELRRKCSEISSFNDVVSLAELALEFNPPFDKGD